MDVDTGHRIIDKFFTLFLMHAKWLVSDIVICKYKALLAANQQYRLRHSDTTWLAVEVLLDV